MNTATEYFVAQRYIPGTDAMSAEILISPVVISDDEPMVPSEIEEVYHVLEVGIEIAEANAAATIAKSGLEGEGCEVTIMRG